MNQCENNRFCFVCVQEYSWQVIIADSCVCKMLHIIN